MTRDERILKDLSENLRNKIIQNIADYVSLCYSAELSHKIMMQELMTLLVRITASFAASQFRISPGDFADVMGRQFEYAMRQQDDED